MAIPRQFSEVKEFVFSKISHDIFDDIYEFVDGQGVPLWGVHKPPSFLKRVMVLVLFHDLTTYGYNAIVSHVDLGFHLSHVSFRENAKRLRRIFYHWGRAQISLGTLRDWWRIAQQLEIPKELANTCLWIDSTDFPMEEKENNPESKEYWSHKENKPGRRFMVLQDGDRRIHWFCGGYSPKVYDGHLLEIQKQFLEDNLKKSVIIADGHFILGRKLFDDITFHLPVIRPSPGRPKKGGGPPKIVPPLTKEQKHYNKLHSSLRSRVESPFAWIKNTFPMLKFPFCEDEYQLDSLVTFAFGVHNKIIQ